MHTAKHATRPLNARKLACLGALVQAYNDERKLHVEHLKSLKNLRLLDGRGVTELRDAYVKAGYASPTGLQARSWKLVLTDSRDLIDRHWQAQLDAVKTQVLELQGLESSERHLLNYTLCSYGMIADTLEGQEPAAWADKFEAVAPTRRKTLLCWLRRRLKAMLRDNRLPVVQAERSVLFDANSYKVFLDKGRSYVALASLEPGKRIVLPLLGDGRGIRGNIRLVLEAGVAHIHGQHRTVDKPKAPAPASLQGKVPTTHRAPVAIDVGFTEVAVDNHGVVYGAGIGKLISEEARYRNAKGIRRNKLRAVADKARASGDRARARRIEAHNLGTQKQTSRLAKAQAGIEGKINYALNLLLGGSKDAPAPAVLVMEDLSRAKFRFEYGAASNRSVSAWTRGVYTERLNFKAQMRGSHLLAVNPAYSSQLCPDCGFVDSKNRTGDRFCCLYCKRTGSADHIAAINLLARASDTEITRWMPFQKVKAVLEQRFKKRQHEASTVAQAAVGATVTGRTLDVANPLPRGTGRVPRLKSCKHSLPPGDLSKSEQ